MFTHELKNSITKTHREILRELNRKLVFWGLMSWLWHSINIKICWKSPQKLIIKRHFCEHWTYITKSGFRSQHIVCFVNWTYSSHCTQQFNLHGSWVWNVNCWSVYETDWHHWPLHHILLFFQWLALWALHFKLACQTKNN